MANICSHLLKRIRTMMWMSIGAMRVNMKWLEGLNVFVEGLNLHPGIHDPQPQGQRKHFFFLQRLNSATEANCYLGAVQMSTWTINTVCCMLHRNELVKSRSSAAPSAMNFCRANKDFIDKVGQSLLWGQCQSNVQHNETSDLLQYSLNCWVLLCNCFAELCYRHVHLQEVDFQKWMSLDSCWTPYFTTAESLTAEQHLMETLLPCCNMHSDSCLRLQRCALRAHVLCLLTVNCAVQWKMVSPWGAVERPEPTF